MNSSTQPYRLKPFLRASLGILALLSPFGFVVWAALDTAPKITIPTPKMPNPNAYDFYIRAANSVVKSDALDQMISRRPLAANRKPFTPAQKQAVIEQNERALQLAREGFQHEFRQPPVRSFQTPQDSFGKYVRLSRLFKLESQVLANQGEWGRAFNSDLDILRMGQDLPRGSSLSGTYAVSYCREVALANTDSLLDHLSASELRAATRRLETILDRPVAFAEILEEEKWQGQAGLMEIFRDPRWREKLMQSRGGDSMSRVQENAKLAFLDRKKILRDYSRYMDRCIAIARQPYNQHQPYPAPPDDPINSMFGVRSMEQEHSSFIGGEMRTRQELLDVALHAYRREHGHFPATLQELVPSYLTRMPLDPMSGQAPFLYQRSGNTYFLSSAAPPPAQPLRPF